MRLQFQYGDDIVSLDVERDGDGWMVTLPSGSRHRILVARQPDDILQIDEMFASGSSLRGFRVPFARQEEGIDVSYDGMTYRFQPHTGRTTTKKKAASGILTAPMSGIVVDLMVTVGERVAAYQPLAVIEAMKIMSTLEAPFAGTVKAIHTQTKQQVTHGSPVIEITPLTEGEAS